MNVQQLKAKLQPFDDDLEVMICQSETDFTYSTVENCDVKPVQFKAPDIPKKEWAKVDCVIISDEI